MSHSSEANAAAACADSERSALQLPEAETLLAELGAQLSAYLQQQRQLSPEFSPLLVGIQSGGVWLAQRLAEMLGLGLKNPADSAFGSLNIGFYRDDYTERGFSAGDLATFLPRAIDAQTIILVDDILYTGRTVRAAMNALFDYGRPAAIHLACLIARDGRELPIEAKFCAQRLHLPAGAVVKLRGPDPLRLELSAVPLPRDLLQRGGA